MITRMLAFLFLTLGRAAAADPAGEVTSLYQRFAEAQNRARPRRRSARCSWTAPSSSG